MLHSHIHELLIYVVYDISIVRISIECSFTIRQMGIAMEVFVWAIIIYLIGMVATYIVRLWENRNESYTNLDAISDATMWPGYWMNRIQTRDSEKTK